LLKPPAEVVVTVTFKELPCVRNIERFNIAWKHDTNRGRPSPGRGQRKVKLGGTKLYITGISTISRVQYRTGTGE